ncbi:sigma-54-dependent Fis family transcriptional regulator [bacterium]|nr:MAG: sigma-54-dependent Fis family transcriptional regulator [bacterium]
MMNIQALKFFANVPGKLPSKCSLDIGKSEDLRGMQETEGTVVFIVEVDQLKALRDFRDVIVDRGRKHERKGLSKLLLGYKKIPLINGDYSNVGQMKRSVKALLENASKYADKNIYFIGVNETHFRALAGEISSHDMERNKGGYRVRSIVSSLPQTVIDENKYSASDFLGILGYDEEPSELAQTYIGSSTECRLVRQLIMRAAKTDATILILGDTGTGKEVVARAIHVYSNRRHQPFIAVNCGGIAQSLFESELFGHEKGAFTGAICKKEGLWQMADQGTLFLDEIGDLREDHQDKLLRALDSGHIRPVGSQSKQEIEVNARIIAATNHDLYAMVKSGQFREDLYYRLRGFQIRTPALRNHMEDLPALASSFWKTITQNDESTLPKEIIAKLGIYRWPGNARELKAVLIGLHGWFKGKVLSLDNLMAILSYQDETPKEHKGEGVSKSEGIPLNIQCLKHLRRVEEVITTSDLVIRSILGNCQNNRLVGDINELLRLRLNELEILCLRPLLFSTEILFSDVNQFKGKLFYFQNLLQQSVSEALQYGKKEVLKDLKHVVKKVTNSIRLLQAEAS